MSLEEAVGVLGGINALKNVMTPCVYLFVLILRDFIVKEILFYCAVLERFCGDECLTSIANQYPFPIQSVS